MRRERSFFLDFPSVHRYNEKSKKGETAMQIFNTLTRQKEEFVPQVPGEYRILSLIHI